MIEENENAPTEPARVKKNKPKRGLGQAITRKRRQQADELNEQVGRRLAAEREAARQEIERMKQRASQTKAQADDTNRWALGILRTVVNNQTALLRAWGYPQAVQCNVVASVGNVVAWTDFKKINVTWPIEAMPNRLDAPGVLDTIAQMKGVMQHEMGHLRFTTSWDTVLDEAPPAGNHPSDLLFKCWNMLEDQRMETLVCKAVPRISNYFGTMVANICLLGGNLPLEQTWIMLAGREYLPKAVLRQSYELFDQFCFDNGIVDGAFTWYELVQDYKAASSSRQIMSATENAYEFIQRVRATMPEAMDNHSNMDTNESGVNPADTAQKRGDILGMFDEKPKPPSQKKSQQDPQSSAGDKGDESKSKGDGDSDGNPSEGDTDDDAEGKGSGKADDDADIDSDDNGGGGEGGSPTPDDNQDPSNPGQSDHGDGSEKTTTEDDLEQALSDMLSDFQQELRKDGDVLDMARNANTASDYEGLPVYTVEQPEMSPELVERANYTALGIEHALNTFVTDAAPTWHNRREQGVIDPLAYRTKGVGDRDFRRHLDDRGQLGLNVHVSMLCDVSGSMGSSYYNYGGSSTESPIQALSESLYAVAVACRRLGIGSTYTLWSSGAQNYRVWPDSMPTPTLWPTMGGTDPTKALDDLDTHNPEGAEQHLVVIFTDGAWSGNFPSLQRWAADGRTFILVRYGSYDGAMQKDMGADRHVGINNVHDLPGELTKALTDVLAEGSGW